MAKKAKFRTETVWFAKFIRATEDWSPSFDGGLVHVQLRSTNLGFDHPAQDPRPEQPDELWRILIRGKDDTAMEKCWPYTGRDDAINTYNNLGDGITFRMLRDLGFKNW